MRQKQKTEEKEERERLNDGDNNGKTTHGARKHAWRMHGARKPPGPKLPRAAFWGDKFPQKCVIHDSFQFMTKGHI